MTTCTEAQQKNVLQRSLKHLTPCGALCLEQVAFLSGRLNAELFDEGEEDVTWATGETRGIWASLSSLSHNSLPYHIPICHYITHGSYNQYSI